MRPFPTGTHAWDDGSIVTDAVAVALPELSLAVTVKV
jgi:hypothetical protein